MQALYRILLQAFVWASIATLYGLTFPATALMNASVFLLWFAGFVFLVGGTGGRVTNTPPNTLAFILVVSIFAESLAIAGLGRYWLAGLYGISSLFILDKRVAQIRKAQVIAENSVK